MIYKILATLLLIGNYTYSYCQSKKKINLKDSIDNKLDLSDYILYSNGFVPVPIIITEPALGGFGGGLIPVFIKQNAPYEDSIDGKLVRTPVAPDITGGAGFYTSNNSWMAAAFRSGTFVKSRIKYRIGGGYSNINMSYYRTDAQLGEKEFRFNGKAIPLFIQASKRLRFSPWYAGLRYLLLNVDLTYVGDPLLSPEFVKSNEYKSIVSQLGAVLEFDKRDNIFTPDNGLKFHADASFSDDILGSDYNFIRTNLYGYFYKKLHPQIVGAIRIDAQQVFDDPPFFLLPSIEIRGVAAARYQGNAVALTEAELRWDIVKRWSAVFFGGTGKAINKWDEFGSGKWITGYGTGFRYLLARKLKLRAGVDIARSPDTWAYYIVFGSNWSK